MGCLSSKKAKYNDTISEPSIHKREHTAAKTNLIEESPYERKFEKVKTTLADPRVKSHAEEAEHGEILKRNLTVQDKSMLINILSSHFIFNSLSRESLSSLVGKFILYSFNARTIVFSEGTNGQNFYVVFNGSVEVIVNSEVKATIPRGGHFGELALLHDSKRTATIKTVEKSMFWVLARDVFREVVKSISDSKVQENRNFIENIPIFSRLTQQQKDSLVSLLITHEFSAGQRIVSEGDAGDLLYIIKSGTVSCIIKGAEIRKLTVGDFFGEQALLYKTTRTASVKALDKVSLLSLKSDDLINLLGTELQNVIYKNSQRISIEKSEVLKHLTKDQVEACVESMRVRSASSGKVIIKKGTMKGETIIFVLKGSMSSAEKVIEVFGCEGDIDLMNNVNEEYTEDWVAQSDSDLALISKGRLEKCLGGALSEVIKCNQIMNILKRVQIFRSLPKSSLESLINMLSIKTFEDGEKIFAQGDAGSEFFIVKEGKVEVLKDGFSLRLINRDDFFGERAILTNEPRTATVMSKGATCWVLSKDDFLQIIDKSMRKHIKERIQLQNDKVNLKELTIIKLLGQGMFGSVYLTHNYETRMSYALKTVQASKIAQYDLAKNLELERQILMQIDHPFIVKLVKTFKDQQRMYFLMEFVQGRDLFDTIREIPVMNDSNSSFYIACLVLILEHLHERNIIYRDLKPENIMVDQNGYLKLIDFGTANLIKDRTYTVVGTAHYMAPEIIKGTGYGLEADLWSMGVILYEFICCAVPFGEQETDPYKIYKFIIAGQLKFPPHCKNLGCRPFIEKLLNQNPALRGNCETLKKNSWFVNINWDFLLSKKEKAPFIPTVSNVKKDIQSAKPGEGLEKALLAYEESFSKKKNE